MARGTLAKVAPGMDPTDTPPETPSVAPTPPSAHARTPRVLVVGGGRGGVGKSLLTVNLGVYLAQLGRRVLVADVDPAGSDLHGSLGLERAPIATRAEIVAPAPDAGPAREHVPRVEGALRVDVAAHARAGTRGAPAAHPRDGSDRPKMRRDTPHSGPPWS